MGLFIEEEIELPTTGKIVSNVYISFSSRTFGIVQYQHQLNKIVGAQTGYSPDTYVITITLEYFSKDKSILYEHSDPPVSFFVSKNDISTIPLYSLAYRELKKMYPTARDSI